MGSATWCSFQLLHCGGLLHCEGFTHWLLSEQPLQQLLHTQAVPAGLGPQPAVCPFARQQVPPLHMLLQHWAAQEQADCIPRQAGVPHTLLPHVAGQAQVPQGAVRLFPQLSAAVNIPQFFPRRAQKPGSSSAEQAQTLIMQV